MTRKFGILCVAIIVLTFFCTPAIFAEAEEEVSSGSGSSQVTGVTVSIFPILPGPPTVMWVSGVQAPTHVTTSTKIDVGIVDVYLCQPTYVFPSVETVVGKLNAVSVIGAEGLLPAGRHRLVVKGIVPASVAKHTGVIKWRLSVMALGYNGMPIQFVYGFPVWIASEVVKK